MTNNGQTIAVLKDEIYKTQTGGIICYDIDENRQGIGSDEYKKKNNDNNNKKKLD